MANRFISLQQQVGEPQWTPSRWIHSQTLTIRKKRPSIPAKDTVYAHSTIFRYLTQPQSLEGKNAARVASADFEENQKISLQKEQFRRCWAKKRAINL